MSVMMGTHTIYNVCGIAKTQSFVTIKIHEMGFLVFPHPEKLERFSIGKMVGKLRYRNSLTFFFVSLVYSKEKSES